jgi:uncharacterized heparinase superfamily protein
MSRGLIAERAKLSWYVARRALMVALARLNAHPLIRWRFASAGTDRLLIAPQDLRTADPTRASEIYAGRFAFAGKIVICDGRSPFVMLPPSDEWAEVLFGFGWLRHLRAAESGITRANARALVDEWISLQGAWDSLAWRPDVVARRILSWLSQAPLVLHDADVRFYRRFLRSLTRQVRYLRRTAGNTRDGLPRFQCIIALTSAALCMAGQERLLKSTTRRLVEELQRQILPDGGHVSRNPARSPAVAAGVCCTQRGASGGVEQCDRPHDADAAVFPPRRRQLCPVQRHGPDPGRSARHRAGLR